MLTAWLMSVAIPGVAIGGPFEDASAAFTRGDYATALGLLRPLAEQGLAKAQYAKQHGGSIEVDTRPGEFTEFRIVLPRAGASLIKSGERG